MPRFCQEDGCEKYAGYALSGESPEYCYDHIKDNMIYVKKKRECEEKNCTISPSYGDPIEKIPITCKKHMREGMVDVIHAICIHDQCSKRATMGFVGKKRLYCGTHYPKDDKNIINLDNKKCKDCNKKATYGDENKSAIYCKKHKKSGMIELTHKKCEYNLSGKKCLKTATFGYEGGMITFCGAHYTKDMIDLRHRKCKKSMCYTSASYGLINGKAEYCAKHKLDNMVDVISKKCAEDGCIKIPIFGYEHQSPTRCSSHKFETMIDVKNKKCEYVLCNVAAIFGNINECPKYCGMHAEDGMINLISKKCIYISNINGQCMKGASYGDPKYGKLEYCAQHAKKIKKNIKKQGLPMINIEDLKHKRCTFEDNCKNPRSYGLVGSNPIRCRKHKEQDMINLKVIKCNSDNACNRNAHYGILGNSPIRCSDHKLENMIKNPKKKCEEIIDGNRCRYFAIFGKKNPIHCNIHMKKDERNMIEKNCKKCKFPNVLYENSICYHCNGFKKITTAKQNALMKYLDSKNLNGASTDKMIDNGELGKERPDRVFRLADKILIIECDEDQHKRIRTHTPECDNIRMLNIGQMFKGQPVYFIRWNPDKYKPLYEDEKRSSIKTRYKKLAAYINEIINNQANLPHAFVSVFYMYYDEWNDKFDINQWKILQQFYKNI